MKGMQTALWSVWLSGIALIVLSLYATKRLVLPPSNDGVVKSDFDRSRKVLDNSGALKIVMLTSPSRFDGPAGDRHGLAVRSWLALSSQIKVVMFSQDPSAVSFARKFGSRVSVDSRIDFTFLGTPFFHSMMAKSQTYDSDIVIMIDPETIVLPDLFSALNFASKLEHDWLLVASSRNVSYFPFDLDKEGKYWLRQDGRKAKLQKMQKVINQNWQADFCEGRMLMAWNSLDVPLHCGVLPPFLYQKGIHNHWIINEALSCGLRFVFDASWSVSSFFLDDRGNRSGDHNATVIDTRIWEYSGNSHLGRHYGSLVFREINYSSLAKLLKCNEQYVLVNATENVAYPFTDPRISSWKSIVHSWRSKKKLATCIDGILSQNRILDCSFKDRLKLPSPIYFPFPLPSLLQLTADKNSTIVLAVAGYSYKDMLMSWVCRLRHLAVTNFVVCALDEETYQFSILQGLPVFLDPSAPRNVSFDDCHFGTKCFQKVTKVKSRLVLKILKLGYNVLLSDVDVYWFKSSLPLLHSYGPAVLAAQSDEYNRTGPINLPRRLNSGFYFARSDGATIAALEKVVKHATSSGLSEQPSFYDTLCGEGGSHRVGDSGCLEPETNLTVHFLDRGLFPNGAYLNLWEKKDVKAVCMKKGCYVLHNNWINGRMKKLVRQMSTGLWEYDISTRMCLQG